MVEIIQTSFIIALFCCSWDILLQYDPNEPKRNQMLLYFFRKCIEDINEIIQKRYIVKRKKVSDKFDECLVSINQTYKCGDNTEPYMEKRKMIERMRMDEIMDINIGEDKALNWQFYLKPILLCKYCFPSFYGTIIFILLNGFHVELWEEWLLSIICSVIMVGIISRVHEKLNR